MNTASEKLSIEKQKVQAIIHYWQQIQRLCPDDFELADKKIDFWAEERNKISSKIYELGILD